jgi:hypothetical protein
VRSEDVHVRKLIVLVADKVLASELEPHLVGDRLCCPSIQRVRVIPAKSHSNGAKFGF